MNPFIKYPGGKIKEFPLVDKYKPKHIARYFEPFVGGGAIYFNINIQNSYINDKSKDLIDLYKYIQCQDGIFFAYIKELDRLWKSIEKENIIVSRLFDFENFYNYNTLSLNLKKKKMMSIENNGYIISQNDKDELVLTAKKTAFYMCVRDLYNKNLNTQKHTACFYFLREYCYSSMFRFSKDGKFNVPYGGRSYNFKHITPKIEQLQSNLLVEYLKKTSIYNLDFEGFLNLFDLNSNDFIFLDPPYDSEFSTYDNHSFDKEEQIRLSLFLKTTSAKWMLIIKKTDFIYELYKSFYIFEYEKNYLVSFKNRNTKNTKHLLITNYMIEV